MTALWSKHPGGTGDGHGDSFIGGNGYGCGNGHGCGNGTGDGGSGDYYNGHGNGDWSGDRKGDGGEAGEGFPEQDVDSSHVAISRALVEYPTLPVVELATLAVTT